MGPIYCTAVHHRPSRGSAAAWQGDERFSALSAPWINKYRSLLIIYDNTALRTSLRTLDGQRVGLVIYPAAVWTRDVVVVRAGGWVPVTSPPSGWRQGAMNNENIRVHASSSVAGPSNARFQRRETWRKFVFAVGTEKDAVKSSKVTRKKKIWHPRPRKLVRKSFA